MFACSSKAACRSRQRPSARASTRSAQWVQDESGFTLIELLAVILIIGVLAAIAVPVFLSETGKAKDTQAKELVRTAQTTAETVATDNSGGYERVTMVELHNLERSIPIVARKSEAYLSAATGSQNGYSLTATATNGDELTISKSAGVVTRRCASPVGKTGCSGGETGSW